MSERGTLAMGVQALFLLLSLAGAAWPQARTDLFDEGIERYRAGDYVEAQRLLREYVEAYGEGGGPAAEHLGEAYHHLGLMTPDAERAEGYFLAVAQRYPASPVADESLARLGHLYTVLGNLPEARRQWQALGRDYPLSRYVPEIDLRFGQTFFAEREWEKAYAAFSAGFAKMKDYQRSGGRGANLRDLEGEYVYWLGRTLMARGAFGDARKYLNLVLLDYPNHPLEPLALYYLTENYREEGKEREAGETWRRFSESVRNTSLEPLAENPDLIAIARARESGALAAPERGAPREEEEAGGATPGGEETVRAPDREESAPDAGAPGMRAPAEDEGLRAPEPGRAGGIVEAEPFGRRVEGRAAEEREGGERGAVKEGEAAGRAAADEEEVKDRATADEEEVRDRAAAVEEEALDRAAADRTREAQVLERAEALAAGPPLEPLPPGLVYLQAGAFTSAESAGKLSTVLKKKGFEPNIQSGLVNGQGYYRVRFGPYEIPRDRSVLEAMRGALQDAGFEVVVMRREREG